MKQVKSPLPDLNRVFKLTIRISVPENEGLLKGMAFAENTDEELCIKSSGCLPETRTEIITTILHWATQGGPPEGSMHIPSADCCVFWLCGVVGSRKSSIAITAAKILRGYLVLFMPLKEHYATSATLRTCSVPLLVTLLNTILFGRSVY